MSNYDVYLEESLNHLKKFITDIKSRPILFIGSGFSQRYIESPTWIDLLNQLIEENPNIKMPLEYFIQEHEGNYAKIASDLVDFYSAYAWENHSDEEKFPPFLFKSETKSIHLKYKIASLLIELMDDFDEDSHKLSKEIKLFKNLNPQAIITTNYDGLLESLLPKYEVIVGQQIVRQKKSTDIGHILKIHGSVEECETIVIEEQDYKDFFDNQIYLIAKLFTYFIEHPIVFIGYSLTDENIKDILFNVKQIINSKAEPLIENMWFIDWSPEQINETTIPSREKNISVGNGESVRVNYIKLHTYEELYETLYQDSVDIDLLKQIEKTVYNVVKSDTIANLEVDIASLQHLTDRESFLKSFTFEPSENYEKNREGMYTFAHISDANQLASRFTLTASELSESVFGEKKHWYHVYALISDIEQNTGINLRNSNNKYHVYMKGVTRFSMDMVNLLRDVRAMTPYTFEIDGRQISHPME